MNMCRIWGWLLLAAVTGMGCADAEGFTPVPGFSPELTERLARQMYVQDMEVAKATDILFAAHPLDGLVKEGFADWVVVSEDGVDVVRFLRRKDGELKRFYDIRFPADGDPVLSQADGAASEAEQAQLQARHLAAKSTRVDCTEYFKTIALHNPAGSGWLVWMIPAEKHADRVIVGGAARYTISDDGKSLLRTDSFSEHCTEVGVPKEEADGSGSVLWTYHRGLYPTETQLFFTLNYHRTLFESTPDGLSWRIRDGHVSEVTPEDSGMDGMAARTLMGAAEYCLPVMKHQKDDKSVYVAEKKNIPLTAQLEHSNALQIKVPEGKMLSGISCRRNDLVPLPNDYKVLLAGAFLMIADLGAGHAARVGMLSVAKNRIVFKLLQGPEPTEDLSARMRAQIAKMQFALDVSEKGK